MSFTTLLRRDLALMFRQGGSLGAALSFMLAFVVMIPLALGPDQGPKHERRCQADERVKKVIKLECRQKPHDDCLLTTE